MALHTPHNVSDHLPKSLQPHIQGTALPADPRAQPQAYSLRLSLPDASAFAAPNTTGANGVAASPTNPTGAGAAVGTPFTGVATVTLNITGDTSCLVFNAAGLNVSRVDWALVAAAPPPAPPSPAPPSPAPPSPARWRRRGQPAAGAGLGGRQRDDHVRLRLRRRRQLLCRVDHR